MFGGAEPRFAPEGNRGGRGPEDGLPVKGLSRSHSVVSTVAREDPDAAISMMDRYPNDVTDRVIQNFIWQSFRNDPTVAVSQISRIADENERDRTYGRTISYWMREDSDAANAWIRSNPLPPKVQEEIELRRNRQR